MFYIISILAVNLIFISTVVQNGNCVDKKKCCLIHNKKDQIFAIADITADVYRLDIDYKNVCLHQRLVPTVKYDFEC